MAETTIDEFVHWEDEPDIYDTVALGGELFPGVAKIKFSRKRKIDKKSAKGKNKAKVTIQGWDAAEMTVTWQWLSREDDRRMRQLMPLLESESDKDTADKDALDIACYATSYRNVKAVIVEDIDGPELVDGIMTMTVKLVEFHKEPTATTGKGGAGGAVFIGTFVDFENNVLPGSRVAYQGPPDKDSKGAPVVTAVVNDEEGNPIPGKPIYTWSLAAIADGSSKGYQKASGGFIGRFIFPDDLLADAWNKDHSVKSKDVTSTPKGSKGGPSLKDFGGDKNDAPKPIDIDADP